VRLMNERNQNVLGAIALIIIIIVIIFSWLILTGKDSDIDGRIILTPLDVTADLYYNANRYLLTMR
jgi:hypothetical protein